MQNLKSNIIIRSNLYPCKEEWTQDSEFMKQIQDYHKINNAMQNKYSSYLPVFEVAQRAILGTGTRCYYSKDDPCRGYIQNRGVKCKCIKKECPQLNQCNPEFTEEYYDFWTTAGDDISLYGKPEEQKKYYLVDLVSDEEKKSYFSTPETDAQMYPIKEDKKKKREKIIIGYIKECFSDYCDEQLSPIYGYADSQVKTEKTKYGSTKAIFINFHENSKKVEPIEKKYKSFNEFSKVVSNASERENDGKASDLIEFTPKDIVLKYESEQDKEPEQIIISSRIEEPEQVKEPEIVIEDYSARWKKIICEYRDKKHIAMQDITEQLVDELSNFSTNEKVIFVFLHEGELCYASNMLSKMNIAHSKGNDFSSQVILKNINQVSLEDRNSNLLISKSIFNEKYQDEFNSFIEIDYCNSTYNIFEMRSKSFSKVTCSNGESRWLMTGVYGATHIEIKPSDLELSLSKFKNDIDVSLIDNMNEEYDIIDVSSGDTIGKSKSNLISALNDMLFSGDIFGLPDEIQNLRIKKYQDKFYVLGIGHMVFAGY